MRFGLLEIAVTGLAFLLEPQASAQQLAPEWQTCTGRSGVDWPTQVQSCTLLIQSTFETSEHRVIAYIRRGIAHSNQGEFESAIADYNEALQLNPKSGQAYYNRGNTYWAEGDNEHAIADFNIAIENDPKSGAAYRSRALTYLYNGNVSKALADITQANKLDPKDAYTALWADIIAHRNNMPGHLSEAIAQIDMNAWPAPVIRMFLGQMTTAALTAMAEDANAAVKSAEICEAHFYGGEWVLRNSAKEEATKLFNLALSGCPRDFLEWSAANAELRSASAAR